MRESQHVNYWLGSKKGGRTAPGIADDVVQASDVALSQERLDFRIGLGNGLCQLAVVWTRKSLNTVLLKAQSCLSDLLDKAVLLQGNTSCALVQFRRQRSGAIDVISPR